MKDLLDLLFTTPQGQRIHWNFRDWLGVSILLLVLAFIVGASIALMTGASPLLVLDRVADLIRSLLVNR